MKVFLYNDPVLKEVLMYDRFTNICIKYNPDSIYRENDIIPIFARDPAEIEKSMRDKGGFLVETLKNILTGGNANKLDGSTINGMTELEQKLWNELKNLKEHELNNLLFGGSSTSQVMECEYENDAETMKK